MRLETHILLGVVEMRPRVTLLTLNYVTANNPLLSSEPHYYVPP